MAKKAGKIALLLGMVTGTAAGLLFAPEEGKNIRTKIAKGDTKGLLDDLQGMGKEIGDFVNKMAQTPQAQEALNVAKNEISKAANMKREELDQMLEDANKKADQFKKTVEKYVKEQKAVLDQKAGKKSTKKAAAKKSTAKKGSSASKAAKKASPKKTTKKTPAKKTSTAKKAPAKKSTAKKTTNKKKA